MYSIQFETVLEHFVTVYLILGILIMSNHKSNRHCGDIVFVVKLDDLDLCRCGSLEGDIVGIHEVEYVGEQNCEIDSVSILNKRVKDVFYHRSICLYSGRRPTSINEQKIYLLGISEHGKTTICQFVILFKQF